MTEVSSNRKDRTSVNGIPVVFGSPIFSSEEGLAYPSAFHCFSCRKAYYCIVQDNPWYSVARHTCPHCNQCQIPTLDILLPINARELDPNLDYFYHQIQDNEFIDLNEVDDCEDFALEFNEPVFRLVFSEYLQESEKPLHKIVNLRLLALVIHAVRCCSGQHSNVKQANLCRQTKILLLHISRCRSLDCLFPYCPPCRSVLCYLSSFPSEIVMKGVKGKH